MDNKYDYSYEYDSSYCYPKTNILRNKLNIKNDQSLNDMERDIVQIRALQVIIDPIKGNFDFEHFKAIHKFLFQDIYGWAGESRTCNIAKTNLFCLAEHISYYAESIFDKIAQEDYFIDLQVENKIEALANTFCDINALHPFREGNGRAQREFIKGLAKVSGIRLDFTKVNQMEMIVASSESTAGDNSKMIDMFKEIATTISVEEQLKYIDNYLKDAKIKKALVKQITDKI